MTIVKSWLARQVSPVSPLSAALEGQSAGASEEADSSIVRARPGDSDTGDTGDSGASHVAWTGRPDVAVVVEDLSDQGIGLGKISRTLGLTRAEVLVILRRTRR